MTLDAGAAADGHRQEDLIEAVARNRDREAFARLYRHYAPRLRAFLLKRGGSGAAAAEEIVQETMLTVWHRADSFDRRLAAAGTWVFTIARNKRIDRLRRDSRPALDPDEPALAPVAEAPPDSVLEAAQAGERLRRAIDLLPPEQSELVRLAYCEDLTHRDIAAARGLPLGTVKSRIRLALDKLRQALKDD